MQSDHLLRVRANPFSQQYRRYYFADIQALVLTELPGTAAFYLYAAAISLVFAALMLSYTGHPGWGILCLLMALPVLYLAWRVPNCTCYLKTSVSTDKLPAIRHRGAARKAIAMVMGEIERVQGPLSRETLDAHQSLGGVVTGPHAPVPISHYGGQFHWILFGLMLLHASMSAIIWIVGSYSTPLSIVSGATSAAALLLAILAAFKQHRSDMSRGVRWVVYSTLVLYPLDTVGSFAVSIYISLQLAAKGFKPGNTQAIMNHPAFKILRVADLTWFLVLGCIGLVLLSLHKRSTHTPPPLVVSENPDIQADGT
jgi:hypothetical protein